MRDYYIVDGPFHGMSVEQLPTAEINDLLACGVETVSELTEVSNVIERLRLELFIRENNLRAVS